jgi:hypothetical protein
MTAEAHPVDVRRIVPEKEPEVTGFRPDYTDAFEVSPPSPDRRSAEQWSRAVFEGAPRPVRWFLLTGWRVVLGLRPGPQRTSGHVLGWRIVSHRPDTIVLEMRSPIMTARLVLRVSAAKVFLSTNVHYTAPAARPLWTIVGPIHRQAIPYLLGRAASSG